jgi:hypothetical protein
MSETRDAVETAIEVCKIDKTCSWGSLIEVGRIASWSFKLQVGLENPYIILSEEIK